MNSDELKLRRERLGLTQVEFAEILGINSNTVWRYEKGASDIPRYMDLIFEALEARQIEKLRTPIGEMHSDA